MTTPRRVIRRAEPAESIHNEKKGFDVDYVAKLAHAYRGTKDAIARFTKQADKLKGELTQYVVDHGEPDEHGSLWLEANGVKLKRERRVSRTLDVAAAEEWAKGYEVWEMVSELIPEHRELSEDKLVKFAWESDDPEIVMKIQSFYDERETWAFRTP